jgi:hypothetical protein
LVRPPDESRFFFLRSPRVHLTNSFKPTTLSLQLYATSLLQIIDVYHRVCSLADHFLSSDHQCKHRSFILVRQLRPSSHQGKFAGSTGFISIKVDSIIVWTPLGIHISDS